MSNPVISERRIDSVQVAQQRGYYRESWTILIVATICYFIDVFMRYNIPTVMPVLRRTYGWSATTVGWVDSAYLWGYALAQIPWGYVSEKWLGAKWTVAIGTAMIAVASIMFAFHIQSLGLGIAARAAIGIGSAAIWVPLNPALARWFSPAKRGLQTGILGSGSPAGTLAGGALMPFLVTGSLAFFGLSNVQSGFLLSALPGVVMVFIVPFVIHDYPEKIGLVSLDQQRTGKQVSDRNEPTFGYIMTHSWYPYLLALVYAGYLGALYFVWTWFAAYLNAAYKINVRSAGILWAFAATLPALISQPLGGNISDRVGRKRSLSWSLLITAFLAIVFAVFSWLGPTVIPSWALIVLAMFFAIFVNMWIFAWPFTTIMFPTSAGGPIGGVMNTFAQLVGAASPVISGYFIDHTGSYVLVFVAGAVSAIIGWFASLFLKEHRVV